MNTSSLFYTSNRSKTGSEKHNLTWVNLSFNYLAATHFMSDHPPCCTKSFTCWSRNELRNHCEYTAWHWLWCFLTTLGEFRRNKALLKKTSEDCICIYSPTCLKQRTDQWILPVPAHCWVIWASPPWPRHEYSWNLLESGHHFLKKEKLFLSCSLHLH